MEQISNLKSAIANHQYLAMANRKAILISNPRTGRYAARARTPMEQIRDRLASLGIDTELVNTTGPGHATQVAARAAQNGTTDVIVAGGDGTINEAIQGMAGTKARLGIIPRGTANVLARELHLPADENEAIDIVARGRSRTIHFGVAIDEATQTRRYFLLMAGIGVDAAVVTEVPASLKSRFGKAAFWFSGFRQLTRWNPPVFTVEIDKHQYQATFVAIGNAAKYGGDLAITPRARLDLAEFEVCIIQTTSRWRYLHLASQALSHGFKENSSDVRFMQTSSVKAFGDAAVQVDGEVIGKLPMRFEIASDSLEVIVP
jgi:diacylglycerol kinase (ATP)